MPVIKFQVATYQAGQPVRDEVVNVFHLDVGAVVGDLAELTGDVAELFGTYRAIPAPLNRVRASAYIQPVDPPGTTGPPEEISTFTIPQLGSAMGPREVALCLSYSADPDEFRPRFAGRLYVGPWPQSEMNVVPASSGTNTPQLDLQALAVGLQNLGGPDIDWITFSRVTLQGSPVRRWWVDNEWDTQRRRGRVATNRLTGTTSE